MRIRIQKRKNAEAAAPSVGIMYVVRGKLLIDSTPLAHAGHYGDFAIHERGHISYWAELVKKGEAPNSEYEEFPRGRIAYDIMAGKFTLLADACILRRKGIVGKILSRLHIPPKNTEVSTDSHYRSFRCLGRSR
jgi:hypothetical protein